MKKLKIFLIIFVAGLSAAPATGQNFTLSDAGLMALDWYWQGSDRGTIIDRRDVQGPGVEFDIYFRSTEHPGSMVSCSSSAKYGIGSLAGIDVSMYDNYELKFTLISVDGVASPDFEGLLVVGAMIGRTYTGSYSGYRPEVVGFAAGQTNTAISSTPCWPDLIYVVGIHAHQLEPTGWNPSGTNLTLLVEPVPGAVALPKLPAIYYVDADAPPVGDGSSWARAFGCLQDALAVAENGDEIRVAQGTYTPDGPLLDIRKASNPNPANGATGVSRTADLSWTAGSDATSHNVYFGTTSPPPFAYNQTATIFDPGTMAYYTAYYWRIDEVGAYGTITGTVWSFRTAGGGPSLPPPPPDLSVPPPSLDRTATFQLKNGVVIKGGYAGFGEPNADARDIDAYITILSGDLVGNDREVSYLGDLSDDPCRAENSYHVVTGSGTNETAVLDGFTVKGGNASFWLPPPPGSQRSNGGGMYNNSGSPTVTNCTFTDNLADGGGGIGNIEANPILINCTFNANLARGGGGMSNFKASPTLINCIFNTNWARSGGGMGNSESSPIVTNCTFTNNVVTTRGGGMFNESVSSPTLTDCIFIGNSAEDGGGMYCWGGNPILIHCTFTGNSAAKEGGGMYNGYQVDLNMANCIFSENSAGDGGGAMFNMDNTPILANCIFSGNSASAGGGMCNLDGGNPTLRGCLFSGNRASHGGGMFSDWDSIQTVTNCTFVDNWAITTGGMLGVTMETLISNCIFWGNRDMSSVPQEAQIFPLWEQGVIFNCIQGWTGEPPAIGNSGVDPCFVEPGYWADVHDANIILEPGDPSAIWIDGDYHLLAISPCIDAGNPNYKAEPNETDLDGNARIVNGIVDMGAYEHQGPRETRQFYVDADANGANNGSSWHDAYNYLQDALATAGRGDKIHVAQGVYKPYEGAGITPEDRKATFHLKSGATVRGGYAGFGEPDPNARDIEVYETILSGDLADNDRDVNDPGELLDDPCRADNSYHVVTGGGCDPTTVLDGFIITGGNANARDLPGWREQEGGGMYNRGGSPTVTHCTFTHNSALEGGGMHNKKNSDPNIVNCTFSGNAAGYGGGICNWGDEMHTGEISSPTLINCIFSGNHAIVKGGGISDGSMTLINCTFTANSATRGNALSCDTVGWFPNNVQVTNCIIWDGENAIWYGGWVMLIVTYSNVEGGWFGEGNIDADPCFVNAADGDYHLLFDSPCIDTGDKNSIPIDCADLDGDGDTNEPIPFDFDGNPRVTGVGIDMGAYEYFNTAPIADAGPDQIVECACNTEEGTKVILDGTSSYDVDDNPLTFTWTGPFLESPAHGATPTITLDGGCPDEYMITLVVSDPIMDSEPNDVMIRVVDTTPPDFELSVSPTMLWPPDHKMVEITPSWTVSDDCVPTPDVSLVGIVANEGDDTIGDGHTSNDIQIGEDGSIYLRSERSGTGSDRVYTITYQAVDDCGNATVRSATVSIPHDFKVLARIASRWLWAGAGRIPEDLNGDGIVNLKDIAIFANNWIQ